MKNKIIIGLLVAGVAGAGITTVSALSNQSKAEKIAELTGKPVSEIISERHDKDKTYGEIANENGVSEQFRTYNYEHKKSVVQEKIKNGTLTEEEGKKIIEQIEERHANCDGTGNCNHDGMGLGDGYEHNHGEGHNQGHTHAHGYGDCINK